MSGGRYHVRMRGQVLGPYDLEQLRALRDRGQFRRFHEISADGRTWEVAAVLSELFPPEEAPEWTAEPAPAPAPHSAPAVVPPADGPPSPELNPLAVRSFALGLLWLGGFGSALAVYYGYRALDQIASGRGRVGGRSLALTGLTLGCAALLLTQVALVWWLLGR